MSGNYIPTMGISVIEGKGRILIPKSIREELGLHGGEKMRVDREDDEIIIKPIKDVSDLQELKGCIKKSSIDPLDLKKIWRA